MVLKEFLASAKEIATELNGLLKVLVSTIGLGLISLSVYKQLNTIEKVTPQAVVETVCGNEVIDSLKLAYKLADPLTLVAIEGLLEGCQKIKPGEPENTQLEVPDNLSVEELAGRTLLNVYNAR
jgi:hypothetical protein